jgi:hypothetical protein
MAASTINFLLAVGVADPQDLYVFGPPGYGYISQRYGSKNIRTNIDSYYFVL